jgi:tetratricopeptide (TPR) repeat protein
MSVINVRTSVGHRVAPLRVLSFGLLSVSVGLGSMLAAERDDAVIGALLKQNKIQEAQQQLHGILAKNPLDASALSLLGEVKERQRSYREAEELFKQALHLNPALVKAPLRLAGLYVEEERVDEAIRVYEGIQKLQPQNVKVREQLSILLEQKGEHQKSLELAKSIPVSARPDRLLSVMVADHLGLNQSEDAQSIIGEILRKAPTNPELVPQLASIFLRQGMAGDAAQLLQIAEPHQKITASFLAAVAHAQSATGRPDLAKATIAKAFELDAKHPGVLIEKARVDSNAGDWRAAIESLQEILRRTTPRSSVLRNLVFAALQIDDLQTAHNAALDLYELNPDSPENALALSVVLIRASHWGEAKPLLEKVLAARPEDKRAQLALGIVQYNLGGIDQATRLLSASLGQGAEDSEAHYMLGLAAKQRGDIPTAAREMELSLEGSPSKPEALTSLGQFYLLLNDVEKARMILEKVVDRIPNDAQTHYQLGLVYRKLNLMDKAREQMEIFQKLNVRRIPQPTGESPDLPH